MGFFSWGIAPTEGVKGPYTDYQTALDALRADTGASDGDLYQLDDDRVFAALTSSGPGILIPADLYGRVSGYASNASGDAHFVVTDTEAEVLARGWTFTEQNAGTVTGGNGSPFRTDAGTNIGGPFDNASIRFVPTAAQTSVLLLVKAQPISGTLNGQSFFVRTLTGADAFHISCTNGSLGAFSVIQSGTTNLGAAVGAIQDSTNADWYMMFADTTSSANLVSFQRIDDPAEESLTVEVSDLPSTTANYIAYLGCQQGSIGSQTVHDYFEAHALVMTT
tara:strand:+ start:457 stop:1290 length:834 start_codon:yes stop_codon:yes gene_type:complete